MQLEGRLTGAIASRTRKPHPVPAASQTLAPAQNNCLFLEPGTSSRQAVSRSPLPKHVQSEARLSGSRVGQDRVTAYAPSRSSPQSPPVDAIGFDNFPITCSDHDMSSRMWAPTPGEQAWQAGGCAPIICIVPQHHPGLRRPRLSD